MVTSLLQVNCNKEVSIQMKKILSVTVSVFLFLSIITCSAMAEETETQSVLTVAVGIVPEAAFVEAVAGELADIVILVPPGNSPANYQPTATEMQALSDAAVYFTLQMPTERANILPKVADFNEDILIVDLREAVIGVYPLLNTSGEYIETTEDQSVDPHVWLSPKRASVMVQTIADELAALDEANADTYQANAAAYIAQLEALDTGIQETVSSIPDKSFLIYHAAYNYFAHDYDLTMIAIEIEGKQATAAELQGVIDKALENGIKTVFYQAEFDDHQAMTVAEEIGGTVAQAAPLSPNYIQGLKDFVNALAQSGE
jgi:zinc transport system substrate-binding protein